MDTQFLCQIRNLKFSAFFSFDRVDRTNAGLYEYRGGYFVKTDGKLPSVVL
jgi:hypothetical protein